MPKYFLPSAFMRSGTDLLSRSLQDPPFDSRPRDRSSDFTTRHGPGLESLRAVVGGVTDHIRQGTMSEQGKQVTSCRRLVTDTSGTAANVKCLYLALNL